MADTVKWAASAAQILGYAATSLGWAPWNIGFFLIGLCGWLAVGLMWRERAIVILHIIALAVLLGGLLS